jgi:hypothetical protein
MNKPDLMEKLSPPKLEKPLDPSIPNGKIYKIGLLVLLNVVEVLKPYTEFACKDLTLMLDLVLEKQS